jgi:hypothetical protein
MTASMRRDENVPMKHPTKKHPDTARAAAAGAAPRQQEIGACAPRRAEAEADWQAAEASSPRRSEIAALQSDNGKLRRCSSKSEPPPNASAAITRRLPQKQQPEVRNDPAIS